MLLHLATLDDLNLDQPVAAFRMHAATDRVGAHRLTDSPAHADIILFTQCHMLLPDWRLQTIRRHRLTRQFREKVLVYNECDQPWCAFPGVYVNMPARRLVEAYQRPWGYFVPPPEAVDGPRDLLFSFVASGTARCRRPLFGLRHPDAIVEEVRGFRFWDPTSEGFQVRRQRFQSTLARSRFVLCPRGNGTSSVRLYEAIAVGAVPVIIADDWVAPAGPVWEDFSIRWPEGRTEGLARMLEARDGDWPRLSAAARRAHEEYFSPAVYFHQVAQRCADLMRAGATSRFPARGVIDRQFADVAAGRLRARIRYAAGRAVDTARDRARARSQS
jgi:hypothetical protein